MRELPKLTPNRTNIQMTTGFKGYDHNEIISDGAMYDMSNMSGDLYPLLTIRKKRGLTCFDAEGATPVRLSGIYGRDNLVLVRGTEVFYNMVKVTGLSVSADQAMIPKQIVGIGAYTCIWPDKVYFNTVDLTDCGSMERRWTAAGNTVSMTMCRLDGTAYNVPDAQIGPTAPASPTNGMYWIDQSGDNDVLRQYSTAMGEWVEVATTYVKISATGIGTGLKEWDAITLSGLTAPDAADQRIKNQVSAVNKDAGVVYARGEDYIVVVGLIAKTVAALKNETVHADRKVPDLDWVVECNNRLWGCKFGLEDGQYVNEIRSCALGDFKNWKRYMGLSTDSYAASVGTDGFWTGAAVLKGYPVFFKEHCLHRISGSAPSSFQITTTMCRGVQDGSGRSVAVVDEAVFYKSSGDVMMYDGGLPTSVGAALGGVRYRDARGGALNNRYYITMQDQTNAWTTFVLDTKFGKWWKEDGLQVLGYGRVGDELWAIDEANNRLIGMTGSLATTAEAYDATATYAIGDAVLVDGIIYSCTTAIATPEEWNVEHWAEAGSAMLEDDLSWYAVFGLEGTNGSKFRGTAQGYRNRKYISRFDIQMYIEPGHEAKLWIQYDGGDWQEMGTIKGSSLQSFTLPVVPRRCDHLRFKLAGDGEVRIYQISRLWEAGSDG